MNMKKLISIITVFIGDDGVLTSYLKSDLEELETYTNNDITSYWAYIIVIMERILFREVEVQVKQARLASGQFQSR